MDARDGVREHCARHEIENGAKMKIVILSGGPSGEHPISIKTGLAASAALERLGFETISVRIEQNGRWILRDEKSLSPADGLAAVAKLGAHAAFIALHGPFGEDGVIQALLETIGLGYQGSGVRASALAMNKSMTKTILSHAGLPVAPEVLVTKSASLETVAEMAVKRLSLPLFVKPAHLGSSVGAGKANSLDELSAAINVGLAVDDSVVVEPLLIGQELTCGVLMDEKTGKLRALPSILIEPVGHEFFDFESKYT